jgi:hypothetical protein
VNAEPLDELFLTWLYGQVADTTVKDSSLSYWRLLRQLYTKEFVWLVPNDDNRLEDGKDLRLEFIHEMRIEDADTSWIEIGCSVLELMVGLSRRLAFEADGEPYYWFWKLIENLRLMGYNDLRWWSSRRVDDILDTVILRQYDADGHGGFFPLRDPPEDQRQVELWYQLSAYVLELTS